MFLRYRVAQTVEQKVHIKLRAVGGTKTKSPGPGNHSAALTAARELARVGELDLQFFYESRLTVSEVFSSRTDVTSIFILMDHVSFQKCLNTPFVPSNLFERFSCHIDYADPAETHT